MVFDVKEQPKGGGFVGLVWTIGGGGNSKKGKREKRASSTE